MSFGVIAALVSIGTVRFADCVLWVLEVKQGWNHPISAAAIEALESDLAGDVKRLTNFTPEYRLRVGISGVI
jgi:hypothetical protein